LVPIGRSKQFIDKTFEISYAIYLF